MTTATAPAPTDTWPRRNEHGLSDQQRDECLAAIDRDSFVILPHLLPQDMIDRANAYIDECCARFDREERDHPRYHETNIVEHDPVFREFLLYLPALQLSYDVFGPMSRSSDPNLFTAVRVRASNKKLPKLSVATPNVRSVW